MAKLRRSLTSILIVVAFLVLTAIATVLYGGSEEQKVKMEQNFFYQKARLVFDYFWVAAQGLIDIGLNKEGGNRIIGEYAENSNVDSELESGFWSRMGVKIKEAWEKSAGTGQDDSFRDFDFNNFDLSLPDRRFLDWQKTETGAELIFKKKSGEEYKLPLPFKFLSR